MLSFHSCFPRDRILFNEQVTLRPGNIEVLATDATDATDATHVFTTSDFWVEHLEDSEDSPPHHIWGWVKTLVPSEPQKSLVNGCSSH